MFETVLSKLGLPVLVALLGGALSKVDNPVAQGAADALNQLEDAIASGTMTPEEAAEANRHLEKMEELKGQELAAIISEINQSVRAEVASNDPYVRRMRPTFGYLMAVTWAMQMGALAYVIVFDTARANIVLQAMESLGTIWAVGLSVLGIYVYKRSEDKRIQQGFEPTNFFSNLKISQPKEFND